MTVVRSGCVLLLACIGAAAHAQKDPLDRQGGHPLADRSASLEDLLDQADWPQAPTIPRPAARPFPDRGRMSEPADDPPSEFGRTQSASPRQQAEAEPPRPAGAPTAVRVLQDAIDERNRIVDRVRLFETIEEILRGEDELGRRRMVLKGAVTRQKQAEGHAAMLNQPGTTLVSPAVKAAAMTDVANARAAAGQAVGACQEQMNTLRPLYERVRPEIGPWVEAYGRMRGTILPDRRDPDRQSQLAVLEDAVRTRQDFLEGRVLTGLLAVYEGDAEAAQRHLKRACEGMARYRLFGTAFATDGCHAYLLLDRPDMVMDFIVVLRKLDPKQQTAPRCWLVGLNAMITCRDHEAATYMHKALAQIDFKPGRKMRFEASPLLGDAALFRLTANTERLRDVERARQILDSADPEWDVWQLQRARAALAAADGNWTESLACLDLCAAACPPAMAAEVSAQRAAYEARRPWFRPRPGAN